MDIITHNIVLDTSFVEAQNFLHGSILLQLSEQAKRGAINLFITDIIQREIKSRAEHNLREAYDSVKKPIKMLEDNGKVFRNIDKYKAYFSLPRIEDIDSVITEFNNSIDSWIKENKIQVIGTGHLKIKDVMNDYFNGNPPFGKGNKKSEFPDAFTLKTLCDYFKRKKETAYILSSDQDIFKYSCDALVPVKDYSIFIDALNKEVETKHKLGLIKKAFSTYKDYIFLREMIEAEIENLVDDEIRFMPKRNESVQLTADIKVSLIEISDKYSVLNIQDEEALIETKAEFSLVLNLTTEDYSGSYYDKEEGENYFVDHKEEYIDRHFTIPVTLEVSFNIESGPSLGLYEANSGEEIGVLEYLEET